MTSFLIALLACGMGVAFGYAYAKHSLSPEKKVLDNVKKANDAATHTDDGGLYDRDR